MQYHLPAGWGDYVPPQGRVTWERRVTDSGTTLGKWSKKGVPHKGWVCESIEDLGEPSAVCEMCENQTIRYAQHMTHASYPGALSVGVVCATRMEEEYAAESRDRAMRNRASRRKNWLNRKWMSSPSGDDCLTADGFRVEVYERTPRWWVWRLTNLDTSKSVEVRDSYVTSAAAKLGAFDAITKVMAMREKQAERES